MSSSTILVKVAQKLFELDKIVELIPLLYHQHISVRFNAAVKLLTFETTKVEIVLEELANQKGLLTYF